MPNPKRPSPGELLDADDPRPQRVAQLPSADVSRRGGEESIQTSLFDTEALDHELQAHYGMTDSNFKPAFLYVERGPGAGQLLEVKQGAVVVGRASVSDLRVQHPSISRRHAQIKRVGDQFFVKDLGSQNGTFVNKSRIATEVELKIGDLVTLGNAQLKLRGPMQKGEKAGSSSKSATGLPATSAVALPGMKNRQSTAVVVGANQTTPEAEAPPSKSRALKVAVFAGAMGFGLAAVLAFALMKATTQPQTPAVKAVAAATTPENNKAAPPTDPVNQERERQIQAALARRMAEREAAKTPVEVGEATADEPVIKPTAVEEKRPPAVVVQNRGTPAPSGKAPGRAKAGKGASDDEASADEAFDDVAPAKGNSQKQLLAAYEKGDAETSLGQAKTAGNKELADKLSKFIGAYDAAKEAMLANNGSAAITNFTKAKELDDQLSGGWSKYGNDIRRQLANIYVLAGGQYASQGNADRAKQAFQAALKYDPGNSNAKKMLAELGGGAANDETPAPPPKKAPAKSSIDDAFGD